MIAAVGAWGWTLRRSATEGPSLPTGKVSRGSLRISVLERGYLKAKNTKSIRSELEGESKILSIIKEGSFVKAGELLLELDVSDQLEKRVQQKITFEQAEANLVDAREKLAIQQNESESSIRKAQLALDLAKVALLRYEEGEWPQQRQTEQSQIMLAEQDATRAKERRDWSKRLFEKGFLTRMELEQDELAVTKAEIDVKLAKNKLEVIEKYEFPMQMKKLSSDVTEAEKELERVRRQGEAERAQATASLKAREATFGLEKERLAKLDSQIDKAKIIAPTEGTVVFATRGNGRGSEEPLGVGTAVREREELMELPDTNAMIAEVKIHESVMNRVQLGQRAVVTVDSYSEHPFSGKLSYLSVVPDSQTRWMNPDLRVFRAEVTLDGETTSLRPQLSCSVEIVAQDLLDVLNVPVQAVFRRGGKSQCFVLADGAVLPRDVKLGMSNDRFVEIKDGLKEGEIVALAMPPGMTSEVEIDMPKSKVGEIVQPGVDAGPPPTAAQPEGRAQGMPEGGARTPGNGRPRNREGSGRPGGGARGPRPGGAGAPDGIRSGDAAPGGGGEPSSGDPRAESSAPGPKKE